jgi:hypothetical protein
LTHSGALAEHGDHQQDRQNAHRDMTSPALGCTRGLGINLRRLDRFAQARLYGTVTRP